MDNKSAITVLVVGGPHTGKTTVHRIITDALKAAGLDVTLGENAQQELEVACQAESFLTEAAQEVAKHSRVMVEEVHGHAFDVFAQHDPRPIVSFRGYAHSAGVKIIPVYKDKA